jgi:hypothetical protein
MLQFKPDAHSGELGVFARFLDIRPTTQGKWVAGYRSDARGGKWNGISVVSVWRTSYSNAPLLPFI